MATDLGELLLRDALLPQERLEEAYQRQVLYGGQLDTVLLEMGLMDEQTLLDYLHRCYDLPEVDRGQLDHVPRELLRLVPRRLAERYRIVPLRLEKRQLHVACSRPLDLDVRDDIGFMLSLYLVPHITTELTIAYALNLLYGVPTPARFQHLLAQLGVDTELVEEPAQRQGRWVVDEPARTQPAPAGDQATAGDRGEWQAVEAGRTGLGGAEIVFDGPARVLSELLTGGASDAKLAEKLGEDGPAARILAKLKASDAEVAERLDRRQAKVRWTPADAAAELALAQDRDEIIEVLLRYAYKDLQRCAVFIHLGGAFIGWDAIGFDDDSAIKQVRIPKVTPSALVTVFNAGGHFLGPLPPQDPLHQIMGATSPRASLLLPLHAGGRLLGMLYGDNGAAPIAPGTVANLQLISGKISLAFECIILQQRQARVAQQVAAAAARGEAPAAGGPRAAASDPGAGADRSGRAPQAEEGEAPAVVGVRQAAYDELAADLIPIDQAEVRHELADLAAARGAAEESSSDTIELDLDEALIDESPAPAAPAVATPPPLPIAFVSEQAQTRPAGPAPELAATVPAELVADRAPTSPAVAATDLAPTRPAEPAPDRSPARPPAPASARPAAPPPPQAPPPAARPVAPAGARAIDAFHCSDAELEAGLRGEAEALALFERLKQGPVPASIAAVLDRAEAAPEGHLERQEAGLRCIALGAAVLPALWQRFPGVLKRNPFGNLDRRPHATELSFVCEALVKMGPALAAPLVIGALRSSDRHHRISALIIAAELEIPSAADSVARCLLDREARIALLAADVCCDHGRREIPYDASALIEHSLRAREPEAVSLGIRAARACHDRRAVARLVELLDAAGRDLAEEVLDALREITKQDFGHSARKWRRWLQENGTRRRVEWMIEGLSHKSREVRQSAQQELKLLTGEYRGYFFDSPKAERLAAVARWQAWWQSAQQRADLP